MFMNYDSVANFVSPSLPALDQMACRALRTHFQSSCEKILDDINISALDGFWELDPAAS